MAIADAVVGSKQDSRSTLTGAHRPGMNSRAASLAEVQYSSTGN